MAKVLLTLLSTGSKKKLHQEKKKLLEPPKIYYILLKTEEKNEVFNVISKIIFNVDIIKLGGTHECKSAEGPPKS